MTGSVQDLEVFLRRGKNPISFFQGMNRVRDFSDSGRVAVNRAVVSFHQTGVSRSVIRMFVCIQYEIEFPASFVQKGFDLFRIIGIDGKSF